MKTPTALAVSLAASLVATSALAAPERDADSPGLHASEVGADASYFVHYPYGGSIVLVPWARYAIPRSPVAVDVEVPFTYGGIFVPGNPGIGAHVDVPLGSRAALRAGAAVHLPVASIGESSGTGNALAVATDARAFLDIYRWAPSFVPLTTPLELELRPLRGLYIRALADTQVYLPLLEHPVIPSYDEPIVLESAKIEIEGRSRWGIGGGLDVDAVSALTRTSFLASEPVQVSIEPYLQFANEEFFVRVGVLVPLTEPLGLGGDPRSSSPLAPVTTPTARFGVRLD